MKYLPGKVYLRNRNNGLVYEYESNLAANSNIETFTPSAQDIKESNKADAAAEAASQAASEAADKPVPAVPAKPAAKK